MLRALLCPSSGAQGRILLHMIFSWSLGKLGGRSCALRRGCYSKNRADLWEASEQILSYIFLATETFVFYIQFLQNSIQYTTNNFPNIT